MKKMQNPRTKLTFILTFCLLLCWATVGITADDIRLRKYPSPDGLVLDTIPKGQKVKIIETFGSWRYIVVEGSTYGGGWVHFEDLEKGPATDPKADAKLKAEVRKTPSPKKTDKATKKPSIQNRGTAEGKNKKKQPFHSKVSMGRVKIHPVAVHKEAQKTEPDKRFKKNPDPKKDPPDHALKNRSKTAKKDLRTAQPTIEQRDPPPHNNNPTPHVPPRKQGEPKENFHTPEKNAPMTLIKTAHADTFPKTTVPSNKGPMVPEQGPEIPAAMTKGPERSNASTQPDNTQGFPHKKKEASTYQGSVGDFFNFAFRLLSVILSCLAIIFAYKAKKMAAMGYHLVVQLQQRIETHSRRGFDERY
jgi:hypothetical protein